MFNSFCLGLLKTRTLPVEGVVLLVSKKNIPNQDNILHCLHPDYPLPTNSPLASSFLPGGSFDAVELTPDDACVEATENTTEKPTEQIENTITIQHIPTVSNSIQQPTMAPAWHNPCVVFGTVHGLVRPLDDAACGPRQDLLMASWNGQRDEDSCQFDKFCT